MKREIKRLLRDYFAGSVFESMLLLVSVVAAGILVALVCTKTMTPSWLAPGWSSYYSYPKNIELKALQFTLLLTIPLSLLFVYLKSRIVKLVIPFFLLSAALPLVYAYLYFGRVAPWIPTAITLCLLMGVFHYLLNHSQDPGPRRPIKPLVFVVAGLIAVSYIFILHHGSQSLHGNLFMLSQGNPTLPSNSIRLDLHHNGEQFTSALDFIKGGRPFVTFFWSHGLSDTGVIALAFRLMSRMDFPTMLLGISFATSFAAVSILIIAYGMGLGYFSILILSVLLFFNHSLNLSPLAHLFPVLLSFLLFYKSGKWYMFVLSGVIIFMAHTYRIDYGVYGFMSILALCGYRIISSVVSYDFEELKESLMNSLFFVAGVLVAATSMFLVLGWPGYEWYSTVFFILPKYQAYAGGFSYPLPLKGLSTMRTAALTSRDATLYLASVLVLLALVSQYLYRNIRRAASIDVFFVLMVFLAIVSIRTAFGRSDVTHIHQFLSFTYLLLALSFAKVLVRTKIKPWSKVVTIGVFLTFFNFSTGSFGYSHLNIHHNIIKNGISVLSEYNDEVPDQCSNGLFSKSNLRNRAFFFYDDAICRTREVLKSFDIGEKQLLVVHSASLLYPSLGYSLPTKYYAIGLAITEEMQNDLVSELDRADIKAVLFASGFRAISEYDIPDRVRLPIYHKWLIERFDPNRRISTPLGYLMFAKDYSSTGNTPQ